MTPSKLFSAVILSYNSGRYLEECLLRLAAALAEFDTPSEIWVIDNGSRDDSTRILRALTERFPDLLRPLYLPANTGTTVSRNLALRQCAGRYILVLDSDATIDAAALRTLQATLDADASIGLVAPQLRYPDGRFQISTDQFPTAARKLQRFFALKALEAAVTAPPGRQDVDYAISACWLLPREVLSSVGLLDEKIFYSPEDVDYCVRIWQAGLRIVYEPAALVTHDAQELSRGAKLSKFTLTHAQGLLYYFAKHRYLWSLTRLHRRIGRHRHAALRG